MSAPPPFLRLRNLDDGRAFANQLNLLQGQFYLERTGTRNVNGAAETEYRLLSVNNEVLAMVIDEIGLFGIVEDENNAASSQSAPSPNVGENENDAAGSESGHSYIDDGRVLPLFVDSNVRLPDTAYHGDMDWNAVADSSTAPSSEIPVIDENFDFVEMASHIPASDLFAALDPILGGLDTTPDGIEDRNSGLDLNRNDDGENENSVSDKENHEPNYELRRSHGYNRLPRIITEPTLPASAGVPLQGLGTAFTIGSSSDVSTSSNFAILTDPPSSPLDHGRVLAELPQYIGSDESINPVSASSSSSDDPVFANPPSSPISDPSDISPDILISDPSDISPDSPISFPSDISSDSPIYLAELTNPPPSPASDALIITGVPSDSSSETAEMINPPPSPSREFLLALFDEIEWEESP